jgi:hypothetical protein
VGFWWCGASTKLCFLEEVDNRNAVTLENVVKKWIAHGTKIISDGWPTLHTIDGGVYTHDVVIHDLHFVDPINNETHTKNIEQLWGTVKRMI